MSSGRSILTPDDNPTQAGEALDTRGLLDTNNQFMTNITEAKGWMDYSSSQLTSVVSALQSARQQVVSVSNDATDAPGSPQRAAAAQSVDGILEEMVNYANSQYEGRNVFGGTATNNTPYTVTRNAAGEITAVTYNGNSSAIQRATAPNQRVQINVPGTDVFSDTNPADGSEKVFTELINLRNDLQATPMPVAGASVTSGQVTVQVPSTAGLQVGDAVSDTTTSGNIPAGATIASIVDATHFTLSVPAGGTGAADTLQITSSGNKPLAPTNGTTPYTYPDMQYLTEHLTALQNLINHVDNVQSSLGEKSAALGRLNQQAQQNQTSLQSLLSNYENLDMAQGALTLTNDLNLYQAAINAGGKIMMPSLMQFLH